MTKKAWTVLVGVVLVLALIGLGLGLNIVRTEGWEGVWKRKKDFIRDTHPEAAPMLDEAERRVRNNSQ
ncbi:MAG: hypothetical protein ACR2HJ_09415 [Fimbriimonadales bacterium]